MPPPHTAAFLADPLAYLGRQPTALYFADDVRAGSTTSAPGFTGLQFTQAGPAAACYPGIDVYDSATRLPGQPVHEIRLTKNAADQHVRYLPDQANQLTVMQLDGAAQWVFTGPLSGCHIYVATLGGNTLLFHLNDNTSLENVGENKVAKDRRLKHALPGGAVITHRLTRPLYSNTLLPYQAFAYGRNTGAGWAFWYHTVFLDGPDTTSRTAPLPPFPPPTPAFLTTYWNPL
jgi:hypothetical protein